MKNPNSIAGYNSSSMSKRKDGRFQATARVEGKKIFAYSKESQEEANALLQEKLDSLRSTRCSSTSTLLEVAIWLWYPRIEGLKDTTRRRYEAAFVQHIRPALGRKAVSDITPSVVQTFVNTLAKKQVSRSGKGASTKTMEANGVRFVYGVLHQILDMAEAHELINRNPCGKLVNIPKPPEKRERVLGVEEAATVLEKCPDFMKLPVFMALLMGLRRGEIAGLTWDDLDRKKRTLQVRRQLDNAGKVTNLKTSSSKRTLILPQKFIDFIDTWGDLDGQAICPVSPRMITFHFARFADECEELKGWTFHDLRHGAAGLIEAATGGNVLSSQAVLGHAKPDMTTVYIGTGAARIEEALESLTPILR
jgi:integrase